MQKRFLSVATAVQVASVCAAAMMLCASLPAAAQSGSLEDRLRTQLRSTGEQLRQLQDTQAQLQSDKAAAEQTRDKAQADLKQAQADLDAAKGNTSAQVEAEHALAAERSKHAQDSQQLAKYKSSYEDLLAVSRSQDAQRKQAQVDLTARESQLQMCEAKNAQLYKVGHDILDAYEHIGLGTVFKTREPFAQSARVKYDEIAQHYGDDLYAGKYDPNARPAPVAAASAPAAAAK